MGRNQHRTTKKPINSGKKAVKVQLSSLNQNNDESQQDISVQEDQFIQKLHNESVATFLEESKDKLLEGGGRLDVIDRKQPKKFSSLFQCLTPSSSDGEDNNEEEDKGEIGEDEIQITQFQKKPQKFDKNRRVAEKRIRTNSEEDEQRSRQGIIKIKQDLPDGKVESLKIIKFLDGIDQGRNLTITMLKEKDQNTELFETVFMCKICYLNYDQQNRKPLVLKCGHTFCATCVSQFLKNNQTCPFDKRMLQYITVEQVGRNWDIQECKNLFEEKQAKKESHGLELGLCLSHKKKAKFICETCCQKDGEDMVLLLCSECIVSHLEHKLISIKSFTEGSTKTYNDRLDRYCSYADVIRCTMSKNQQKLKSKYEKQKIKLQDQAEDLIALITMSLHEKLAEAEKSYKSQVSWNSNQVKNFMRFIKQEGEKKKSKVDAQDFKNLQKIEDYIREVEHEENNKEVLFVDTNKFKLPFSKLSRYVDIVDE